MFTGRAPEQDQPTDPTFAQLDRAVRGHRILDAADLVLACPPFLQHHLDGLFELWETEGRGSLVRLLRVCRERPDVVAGVRRQRLVGTIAGFACGLAAASFVGLLGVVAGIAVMIVVRELAAVWWRPTDPGDAAATRALFDLAVYRSPALRTNVAGAVAFFLIGLVTTAMAVGSTLTEGQSAASLAATAIGFALIATGWLTGSALRRLRRGGLLEPVPVRSTEPRRAHLTERALDETVVFRRPRLQRSLLIPFTFTALIGGLLVTFGSAAGIALAAVLVAGGCAYVGRVLATHVEIGPAGIVDRGPIRTPRWTWDDVHEVVTPTNEDDVAVIIVAGDGRRHRLAEGTAIRWDRDTLERFAEAATGLATAPDPGPDPALVRVRTFGIVNLGLIAVMLTAIVYGLLAATTTATVTPGAVPRGQVYWTAQSASGVTYSYIDCPSPTSWTQGEQDPLCVETIRETTIGAASFALVDGLVVGGIVLLVRSRRRLVRARRVARRLPGHGDQRADRRDD